MNRKALLIGNKEYSKLDKLQTTFNDVKALKSVLADPSIGHFEVQELYDKSADQTRRCIECFFEQGELEDTLLLYFSGHGRLDREFRLHLATIDTDDDKPKSSSVAGSFVAKCMKQCRAQKQVLILDCCYSGAFAEEATKGKNVAQDVDIKKVLEDEAFKGEGHVILAASGRLEYAYCKNNPESLSYFTNFLVEGLKTWDADFSKNGEITANELYDYVYKKMEKSRQTPVRIIPEQRGTIVLAYKTPQPTQATLIQNEEEIEKADRAETIPQEILEESVETESERQKLSKPLNDNRQENLKNLVAWAGNILCWAPLSMYATWTWVKSPLTQRNLLTAFTVSVIIILGCFFVNRYYHIEENRKLFAGAIIVTGLGTISSSLVAIVFATSISLPFLVLAGAFTGIGGLIITKNLVKAIEKRDSFPVDNSMV